MREVFKLIIKDNDMKVESVDTNNAEVSNSDAILCAMAMLDKFVSHEPDEESHRELDILSHDIFFKIINNACNIKEAYACLHGIIPVTPVTINVSVSKVTGSDEISFRYGTGNGYENAINLYLACAIIYYYDALEATRRLFNDAKYGDVD